MRPDLGETLRRVFEDAAGPSDATVFETVEVCRVDAVACPDAATFSRWREAAVAAAAEGVGAFEVFGGVSGKLALDTVAVGDVEGEELSLRLEKATRDGWYYFLTRQGFRDALDEDLIGTPASVWVAEAFAPFASMAMAVSPWGGPRNLANPSVPRPERPRKYIRDLSNGLVPKAVEPWLLTTAPDEASAISAIWCDAAAKRIAFVLPAEIREVEGDPKVVLKGPRSAPIDLAEAPAGWGARTISLLSEAASWIYVEEPRTAETRFLFLNNHLSLAWRDGTRWPEGLSQVLAEALVSAREAYGFHLQGETKDALKSLGDLRKSIQEDVARAQGTTRDLIGTLWRDFGIAGIVLALRTPAAQQLTGGTNGLRYVAPATALVLAASLLVTIVSNAWFNVLANRAREDWRRKLYPFVSGSEWKKLVETPIARTRWVYRLTLPLVAVFYVAAVGYLYSITEPSVIAEGYAWVAELRARIGR